MRAPRMCFHTRTHARHRVPPLVSSVGCASAGDARADEVRFAVFANGTLDVTSTSPVIAVNDFGVYHPANWAALVANMWTTTGVTLNASWAEVSAAVPASGRHSPATRRWDVPAVYGASPLPDARPHRSCSGRI